MVKNLKIKKVSAADMVCSKMKDLVVKGEWAVGDKIPSESDLAESFGVNRLTVRIALQRLNALGILETRVGDGSYVRSFDFSNHIAEISDFFVNQKILHDTQEYRWIIQSAAVKLAVQRQTPEVLEKLRQCCQDFEEEVARYYSLKGSEQKRTSLEKTVDVGLQFHALLCELSDNELICLAFSICKAPIRKHMLVNATERVNNPAGQKSTVWIKKYWGIYNALKDKDEKACIENLHDLIFNSGH